MGQLVFQATAGGQVALVGPNPSSNFSLNVPAVNGTLVTTGDTGTVTNTMLAASAYNTPGAIGSGTANTGAFTTLSASSTVSGTGFSTYLASPPAIGGTTPSTGKFTSITNTGLTSGYVVFAGTGGLESGSSNLFWDNANARLGLGTSSPIATLDIRGTPYVINATNPTSWLSVDTGISTHSLYSQFNTSNNAGVFGTYTSDPIYFVTGNTERMRINSIGSVGIGTTSPQNILHIYQNTTYPTIRIDGTGTASNQGPNIGFRCGDSAGVPWEAGYITVRNTFSNQTAASASSYMDFYTSNAGTVDVRARIDSSGNLLVGTTSVYGKNTVAASSSYVYASTSVGNGADHFIFKSDSTTVGSITRVANTGVAYNVTSDQRLKTDNGVCTDISVIDNTVVHNFTWKQNNLSDIGVFAQEAQKVKPNAVHEGTDEVGENGLPTNPWGVDYSKYVPDLIVYCQQLKKTAQEQQAIIEQLKTKVGL